jgi:hypothetical protein
VQAKESSVAPPVQLPGIPLASAAFAGMPQRLRLSAVETTNTAGRQGLVVDQRLTRYIRRMTLSLRAMPYTLRCHVA